MRTALAANLQTLKSSPALVVGLLAWLLALLTLILRVPVGSASTDEAFYSAMTYGFLLGNKPYLDELAFHQNAAILLMPFYRAYVWLHGTDGIALFNRWLYAAYIAFCSYLSFRLVAKIAGRAAGFWCAALVVSFTYYNLLALSYNTCGAFGFLCGVLLAMLAFFERPAQNLFLSSLFFGTAVFSYPTLLLAVVVYVPLLAWRLRQRLPPQEFKRAFIGLGVGMSCCAVAALAFVTWITTDGLRRALEFSRSMGYTKSTVLEKLSSSVVVLHSQRWQWLGFALLFLAFPVLLTRYRRAATALSLAVALAFLALYFAGAKATVTTHTATFQTLVPLLALACLWSVPSFPERRLVVELLWLPGVLSMLAIAYTSANGFVVVYLGTLPTLVAAVLGLWKLSEALSQGQAGAARASLCFHAFCGVALLAQLHNLRDLVYSEAPRVKDNDTRVTAGPFRGAFVAASRAALLVSVDKDLKSIEDPSKTLAIFDSFATGYLSTRMRPRTFTHWVVWAFEPNYIRRLMAMTYGDPATAPDFVLLINTGMARHHRWHKFWGNYEPIISRPEHGYMIFKRRASVPPSIAR